VERLQYRLDQAEVLDPNMTGKMDMVMIVDFVQVTDGMDLASMAAAEYLLENGGEEMYHPEETEEEKSELLVGCVNEAET
jgi:hypothetical protein